MAKWKIVAAVVCAASVSCKGTDGAGGTPGAQGNAGPQGQQGPIGPKGDTGAQGPQGVPGPAGDGGSQGSQGASGTRFVVKTATGERLGAAFPFFQGTRMIAVGFASPPSFAVVDMASGRVSADEFVYFSEAGCTGTPALRSIIQNYVLEGAGSNRLFTSTSGSPTLLIFKSRYDPGQGPGCLEGTGSVTAYPAAEILVGQYPFPTPLSLVYE